MAVDMNMPILIVDDYKIVLKTLRSMLKQLGFDNVEEAMDGSAALQKLRDKELAQFVTAAYSLSCVEVWGLSNLTSRQEQTHD